ncbi:MAG TPA: outer membrane protein assembly factor BamA [Verrucomicrobiae bacterium]
MKAIFRLLGIWLLLGCAIARAQTASPKIDRVDIKFVGPAAVSEQFIRANLRVKAGETYLPNSTQDDVHSLYTTGQFYNIRVTVDQADDGGVILTFIVQARPRITEIRIVGNKKLSDSKLKKKITVKVGEPLDEEKLFTDVQEMKKLYEKYGHPDTQIKYVLNIDENAGRGTVTFEIAETPKVEIKKIEFIGAAAFSQKELRKQIKTSRHRWYSWITGSGVFKQDEFDDDRDQLVDFYRNHGYLDFEIKDVQFVHPTTNILILRFYIYEGRQYKVGSIKFTGNSIFNDAAIRAGLQADHDFEHAKGKLGAHGLPMDAGDIFTPDGLNKDTQALQDFYGSKGYIDVAQGPTLRVLRIPNVDTGTMDLEFQIDEGEKSYVEKINIRGNVKTKDKVIRRELAISPGETFDMVRVKISKERLENLDYFDKVEMEPEPTDPPIAGRKNLDVDVEEKNTGNLTFGAGFSTVDALVGYVELTQGNFDLFHPPNFTGGGQKFRLKIQLGTERQDYEMSFIEPWFLNRKLALGVDLYRHQLDFESPNNIFNETQTGMKLSLTRALWSDFFRGSVSYTVEDVGIDLNSPYHGPKLIADPVPTQEAPNVPNAILEQRGDHFYQRLGTTLAYDTRNSDKLPNHGQRSELDTEFSIGDKNYYKIEAKTDWFFPGFFKGHVIEASGRAGVTESVDPGDVPFYDRYYLGGLYSLRGFKYRNVAPRQPGFFGVDEPIGGDTLLFGSLEYSLPLFEKDGGLGVRFALFYDVGAVGAQPYSIPDDYDDNWGLGFRLNIPHLGPLRLDYGIPIHHDKFNGSGGQFQFGVGYTREF